MMLDMAGHCADPMGMPSDQKRRPELLALCREESSVQRLCQELCAKGLQVDLAMTLQELRSAFFRRGGHEFLILSPDLSPRMACAAVKTLRAVNPELALIVFGVALTRRDWARPVTRLPAYHPSSRAGLGAVLRTVYQEG